MKYKFLKNVYHPDTLQELIDVIDSYSVNDENYLLPPCMLIKSSSESDSRMLTESNHASSWLVPACISMKHKSTLSLHLEDESEKLPLYTRT